MARGKKWSREETILAMDLYTRIPFGKIGKSNDDIIKLANLIGRTPSAVALKMSNLASFDPLLKARNVSGMSHASKLDPIIYKEFANNIEELSYQAQVIIANITHTRIEDNLIEYDIEVATLPPGEYREQQTRRRVGQYFFRKSVLTAYNNACCITGLSNKELLVASHIKPWKDSNVADERTNPRNGLCLNALHDKAFDRGYITINKNYEIIISKDIKEIDMDSETKKWFEFYSNKQIILPERYLPEDRFIEYHNDVIFRGT